jgi:hypothetical protein
MDVEKRTSYRRGFRNVPFHYHRFGKSYHVVERDISDCDGAPRATESLADLRKDGALYVCPRDIAIDTHPDV